MNNFNIDEIEVLEFDEEINYTLNSVSKSSFNKNDEKKIRKMKMFLIILILILILLIGLGLFFFLNYAKKNVNAKESKSKVIELGTKKEDIIENGCELNLDKVNFNKTGKYIYSAKCNDKSYTATMKIIDTTQPEVELKTLNLKINETFEAEDFVLSSYDLSNIEIDFENINISNTISSNGIYIIPIIAKDEAGNITKKDGILLVTNVVADKFLSASKIESTVYDATLEITDKIGFNSSNYYINAFRIYDYTFNSKEDYFNSKEELSNTDGKVVFNDSLLKIKVVRMLTKQELNILNGNFPSTIGDISKLYSNLGYKTKIELN